MTILRENLREVVLLCSSSRGGSSISTEWLRQHTGLLHLRAEINPLLQRAGLVYPHANSSDALPLEAGSKSQREILWKELACEVGYYHTEALSETDWLQFANDLHVRFQWQWPHQPLSRLFMQRAVQVVRERQRLTVSIPSITQFYCELIAHIQRDFPHIDPRWYDIDTRSIDTYFPALGPLILPQQIIEEPPFVLISPWKRASPYDLSTKPLIIKTPSNAYRIPFFRSFFSRQQLKILHLKRQAEHAINGLMDGWMYSRGFHAHWIDSVCIPHPDIPKRLWKYDLPPGWNQLQAAPLHQVCAFQWLQAHRFTLQSRSLSDDYHSIWFSELLRHQEEEIGELWRWLHVEPQSISPIRAMPLVMATCPPRAQRWFSKKEIISQRCAQHDILECMEQLRETKK